MGNQMRTKIGFVIIPLLLLVACTGTNTGTGTGTGTSATPVAPTQSSPAATPTSGAQLSSSENLQEDGQLIPLKSVQLGFETDGILDQVLVSDGQAVQKGQLLAKLGGYEQYAAAVASAKRDVLTAQQALDKLKRDAPVATANAYLTYVTATQTLSTSQRALDNLLKPTLTGAQQALSDAQLTYSTDTANLQLINQGPLGQAVQTAQTNLDIAAYAYDQAVIGCQTGPCDSAREDRLNTAFQNAQSALAAAQLALQTSAATATDKANKALTGVQTAQSNLNALKVKPDPMKVSLDQANLKQAQAALADAKAKWQAVQNGPDPDLVAADQANLDNAQAALTAAEASLAKLELHAPIAGTLANFDAKAGEYLPRGQALGWVADVSGWLVQLDNVTQYDLGSISVGQPVQVTFDGLPGLTLPGHVSFISPYFNQDSQNKSKITFTIQVTLDKSAPHLQWGLTAHVGF
jgi:HlyD family secretion protein